MDTLRTQLSASRTKVMVYGLLPLQVPLLQNWKAINFKLRLVGVSEQYHIDGMGQCDYCVGNVARMRHSIDAKLSNTFGRNYIRVNGGLSSIKRGLLELDLKITNKQKAGL